jgi:hypothetical protein
MKANAEYVRATRDPSYQNDVNIRSLLPIIEKVAGHDRSWMKDAACTGADTSQFFPRSKKQSFAPAIRICQSCPVKEPCLQYALDTDQEGVWGGTTRLTRTRMRQQTA